MKSNNERVLDYLRALENWDADALIASYGPDAVQIEWPNRLKPNGDRRGLESLAKDLERGKAILKRQSYEVVNSVAAGNLVMVEVFWRGELAIAIGNLAAGDTMVAHSAISFTFEDGRITSQRNYDCFDSF